MSLTNFDEIWWVWFIVGGEYVVFRVSFRVNGKYGNPKFPNVKIFFVVN